MSKLQPWVEERNPQLRQAAALQVIDDMQKLVEHPGWLRLTGVLHELIEDGRDMLEQGGVRDEESRGSIRALRRIEGLPAEAIRLAEADVKAHRGVQ